MTLWKVIQELDAEYRHVAVPVLFAALLVAALVVLLAWLYSYVTLGVCNSRVKMDGKTVIVTGANSGESFLHFHILLRD